ncbi:tumor necrosis factor receptor superfamily member 1A-like isoform X2 [Engystomops pustulosus]|uniref:tumor necrosis factor receptor superfamily member 1A-like isoform X2 n=1 Tax=Engystomops pustulosus TaxID=76066 RepID=UPI003AFAF431
MLRTLHPLPLLTLSVVIQFLAASPVPSDDVHNRTVRQQECYEDEYPHEGKCCRTCAAGTFVFAHCTMNHLRGVCNPCTPGVSYTAAPNGLESCPNCQVCKDDKVTVRSCTTTSDALCQCKPGYYCSPDEPCEVCNRCSRCRKDQRIKAMCTPTTNTVCEDTSPPDPTSPKTDLKDGHTVPVPSNSSKEVTGHKTVPPDDPRDEPPDSKSNVPTILSAVFGTILALIILITGLYCYIKRTKDKNENSSENTSLSSVPAESPDPREEEVSREQQRLMPPVPRVEHERIQMAVPYVPVPPGPGELEENNAAEDPGDNAEEEEEQAEDPRLGAICQECGQPQPCDTQWSRTFYIIINNIPASSILQLVRQLHLHKSTIDHVPRDHPDNSIERSYSLLNKWREQKGTQASMRALLQELRSMNLGGCCENIINTLRTEKIPIS